MPINMVLIEIDTSLQSFLNHIVWLKLEEYQFNQVKVYTMLALMYKNDLSISLGISRDRKRCS